MPEKVNSVRKKELLALAREEASLEKSTQGAAVEQIPRRPSMELVAQIRSMRYEPYEYLAALSCWHLLWSEEAAAGRIGFETGDERQGRALLNPQAAAPWHEWTKLLDRGPKGFQRAVERITLDLRKRFEADGNPLAVVGQALHSLNRPVLRWALERISNTPGFADNDSDFSSSFPKVWHEVETVVADEQGNWVRKHGYRRTPIVHDPVGLVRIVAGVLNIRRDELLYMPYAQDGFAAAEIYERAALGADHSPTVITVNDPHYGVVAASRFKHVWDRNRLRVHVASSWDAYAPAPGADVVFCDKLADVKFGSKGFGIDRFPVPVYDSALLQIQQALLSLRPGGRAAIVVPRRFAFGRGAARRVREWILANYRLDAVVEVGRGTSGPDAGLKSILLFVRRLPPVESVLFLPCSLHDADLGDRIAYSRSEGLLITVLQARLNTAPAPAIENQLSRWEGDEELSSSNSQLLNLAKYLHLVGDEADPSFPELVPVADLLRRDAELLWKENRRNSLESLLGELVTARKGTGIARLDEVAEVVGGATYTARDFLEPVTARRRARGDAIGLVRVSDFPRFTPGDPFRPLRAVNRHIEKLPPKNENRVLRPDDVLVSIGGTIGRVCVFEVELGHPSLATNGLAIVRAKDRLTSTFLAKLFTSEPYQQWFAGESTGSTIRHLTLTRLRELPVPVLSRADMLSIADELETDASEVRVRTVFTSKQDFPALTSRLAESRSVSIFAGLSPDELERATATDVLKSACDEITGLERLATREEDELCVRLNMLQHLGSGLLDALALPETGDRFAVLQEWRAFAIDRERDLRRVRNELMHSSSAADESRHRVVETMLAQRTEGFVANLLRLAQTAMQRQLRDVRVTATITPAILTVGKLTEVKFSIRSDGSLPLRKFGATTSVFASVTTMPLLPAGGSHVWSLVFTPQEAGLHSVNLAWNAHRLNGEPVSGSIELALEVQSLHAGAITQRLHTSPYVAGLSLSAKDRDKFFGRQDIMAEIQRSLRRDGPGTVLIIEGVRRVGKTSLLKQLIAPDVLPDWLPVYCSLQRGKGHATEHGLATSEIFYLIAREVVVAAHAAGCTVTVPEFRTVSPTDAVSTLKADMRKSFRPVFTNDPAPFELLESVVESVLAGIGGRHLLLMLDEFDKVQVGIEHGVTSPQVPENLRELFHSHAEVSAILSGSQLMKRLRREYFSPLFGLARAAIPIGALDQASAQQLVTRPVKGALVFSDAARDRIVDLCACQPYLIQHICAEVFNICAADNIESVTIEHVELAAEAWLEREQHFTEVWRDDVEDPRRQYLLCVIAELEAKGAAVTFELLCDTLEERLLSGDKALANHLDHLIHLTLVAREDCDDRKIYRIAVPLLSRWLAAKDASQYLARALREDEGRL